MIVVCEDTLALKVIRVLRANRVPKAIPVQLAHKGQQDLKDREDRRDNLPRSWVISNLERHLSYPLMGSSLLTGIVPAILHKMNSFMSVRHLYIKAEHMEMV